MKKFWGKSAAFRTGGFDANLLLLAFCYGVGVAAGYLAYRFAGYCTLAEAAPQWSSFIRYVWHYAKYLLVAFVCGYTALGLLAQPALLAARGYLMSSAVISALTSFTRDDALRALLENALVSVVSLVCLFLLSVQGIRGAKSAFSAMTHRRGSYVEPGFATMQVVRFLLCLAAVAAAGALNILLAPYMTAIVLK